MDRLQLILIFGAGLITGLVLLPVLSFIFDSNSIVHHFFYTLGQAVAAPFQRIAGLFRTDAKSVRPRRPRAASELQVDAREQRIYDSMQSILGMLHTLTDAIHHTEQATTDSSQTLSALRGHLQGMGLPSDLTQSASHLVAQIDRVIGSNSTLKGELASSNKVLTTQQEMIEALRTAVRYDSMTKLANRSYFDDRLAELIKLKQRYSDPFFLMLLDVDNFKAINDQYGHHSGDRILKGVAFKLQSTLHESDFLARFGGDEFALILVKATRDSAINLAEKLCENIHDTQFRLDNNEITVTLSIGVTEAIFGDTAESLLQRTDEALYQVKGSGRDGVRYAEPPGPK